MDGAIASSAQRGTRVSPLTSAPCTRRRLATWVAFAPRRSRRCVYASALRRRVPRGAAFPDPDDDRTPDGKSDPERADAREGLDAPSPGILARSRRDATVWPVTMRRARCQRDSRHRRGVDVPKRRVRGRTARGFFGDTRGFADKRPPSTPGLNASTRSDVALTRRCGRAWATSERPARLWETSSVRPRPPSSAPPRASLVVIQGFWTLPLPRWGPCSRSVPGLRPPPPVCLDHQASRVIIEKYYSRLTLDFATNKRIAEDVAIIPSSVFATRSPGSPHAPHEAHPKARVRARHLPQAPGGGARAPHGLRARRVRPRGRDHRG